MHVKYLFEAFDRAVTKLLISHWSFTLYNIQIPNTTSSNYILLSLIQWGLSQPSRFSILRVMVCWLKIETACCCRIFRRSGLMMFGDSSSCSSLGLSSYVLRGFSQCSFILLFAHWLLGTYDLQPLLFFKSFLWWVIYNSSYLWCSSYSPIILCNCCLVVARTAFMLQANDWILPQQVYLEQANQLVP